MVLAILELLRLGHRVCLWDCMDARVCMTFLPRWRGAPTWVWLHTFLCVGRVWLLPWGVVRAPGVSFVVAWWWHGTPPPTGLWYYDRYGQVVQL